MMCRLLGVLAATLQLAATAPPAVAQYVRLGSELDDYLRLLELDGRLTQAPLIFRSPSLLDAVGPVARDSAHPWAPRYALNPRPAVQGPSLALLDPELRATYNSAYPRGTNDGALWAGRGASFALSAGARLAWGPLTAVLDPALRWTQNRAFALAPDSGLGIDRAGLSRYAYPWQHGRIDLPERFGDAGFTGLDWGQSGVRLNAGPATVGLTTENLWWGPAVENPIIMSNTAPGFPHLDLGTARPVWIGIGRAEARVLWGRLTESAYFDTLPGNDHRLFAGMVLGVEPKWIPGLTLGLTRVFYQTWDSLSASDFLTIVQTVFKAAFRSDSNTAGDDRRDQMLSLIARWTFPEAGFQAYVEWARNDHNWDPRDFLVEPDHSRAYTLGFQQLLTGAGSRWRLRGEVTTLGIPSTFRVRATPTYYIHHLARQGYTNRGQPIGAGIGPGSQSELLALDRYDRDGRLGAFLQRVRFDDDAYYGIFSPLQDYRSHQTEISGGLRGARFVGPLDISASLVLSRELNRYYQVRNDVTNLMLDLGIRFRR